MFTAAFWKSTSEWVLVAVASAVLSGLTDGVDDWPAFWRTAAIAGGVALLKCVLASRTGSGSPALVEPKPAVEPVRTITPQEDRWS